MLVRSNMQYIVFLYLVVSIQQHLGGYIRSFSFRYEDGAPFSQGFVYLESPLQGGIMELEATFLLY